MATRKRRKKRRSSRGGGAGFTQKLLVGAAGVVLVLCAASVTYSFFFRQVRGEGVYGQFRVEVLNGTGKGGLAQAAMRSLHRRGIDVIEVGNADRFDYPESVLIARKRGADVEKLGRILGCRNVVEQLQDGVIVDATLILGADFRELNLDWELESDLLE